MFDPGSTPAVMAFAALSALCRAGLNLIDRHQIGLRRLPIRQLSLYNNAVPALLLVAVFLAYGGGADLALRLLDWRCAAFGALIQAVAYGFSHAFRSMTVGQVTVAAKTADVFIPLGVFATTGQWQGVDQAFALVTTLAFLPILLQEPAAGRAGPARAWVLVCGLLVVQASAAPLLGPAGAAPSGLAEALLFSTAVICWRTAWSVLPLLPGSARCAAPAPWRLLAQGLFWLRALLTVATQLGFILAVGSPRSAAAWPILNSAGLLAMVLAGWILREKAHPRQTAIVGAVAALAVLRLAWG